MSPSSALTSSDAPKRAGFGWMRQNFFLRDASVSAVHELSDHFRLIELHGEALRGLDWQPGQKIQISVGSGLLNRTYTPVTWDSQAGLTRFVAFLHGEGPGSNWVRQARPGEPCRLLGPRASLDLAKIGTPAALFGDETCFSLAAAWQVLQADVRHVFEVTDFAESRDVLKGMGIENAVLIERTADDYHLDSAANELLDLAAGGRKFALAGRAPSIQRMKSALRTIGIGSSGTQTKAYWAPGKTGLD